MTNILAASLYQYQNYVSLDGHVYSVHLYLMNDTFFQGLTPEQQTIVQEATEIAEGIHREMTASQDQNAEKILSEVGMDVTVLSQEQIDAFREAAQPPVLEYLESEVDQELIDMLFAAIDDYRAGR